MKNIEIYIRHSSDQTLLTMHVPESLRTEFVIAINRGTVELAGVRMNFEMSILPEWIVSDEERQKFVEPRGNMHMRFPLTSIAVSYSQDQDEIV